MKNLLVWDSLKIDRAELEDLLDFNFFDNLSLEMSELLILHDSKNKLSFFLSEGVIAFLSMLFFCPINLLIFQKWLLNGSQLQGFLIIIILSALFSTIILCGMNLALWKKAKKIKSIAVIANKIEGYNNLINNFQILNKFNSLSTLEVENSDRLPSEIITALQTTKKSLINSLELEKFILQNQQLKSQARYQLLNSLEEDLIEFMSLPRQQNETEYQQLIAEAIDLGLSVHQEVRKKFALSS